MSFNKYDYGFNIKDIIKRLLIIIYAITIFYLSFNKKIPTLYSTILFIILGTIIIIRNWPAKNAPLFKSMHNDDLKKFKEYLTSNNLKVTDIHTLVYFQGKTPITYAIMHRAFKIFNYLIDNNYNLNDVPKYSEPAITFVAHSGEIEYLNILLKHKDKFDLYAKKPDLNANALEVAVWRGDKLDVIEALLNAGMKFSIKEYNNTRPGKYLLPFDKVSLEVKKVLVKRCIFDKVVNQLNIVDEIDKQKRMKSFDKVNIFWKEYLDFA